MSGDVTEQALSRLSHLPGSTNPADMIAAQKYYDVELTGGSISNVTLTDVTINGQATSPTLRVVTASGSVTPASDDYTIVINKTVGAATTVLLSGAQTTGRRLEIKDGKGDAATNNITLSGTVDGASSPKIDTNYGSRILEFNGTEWNILAQKSATGAAVGTVTSVDVSGGTTGLTTSGGPITSSGTITLAGTLVGANGGTGVANTGKTITLGGNINTAAAFTTSGANALTLTTTGATNVTLPTTGTLATTAGTVAVATAVTVANEATDTTCFPLFVTAATGDLPPKSNAALTFNSNTASLACTTFVGALTGNASTATALATGRTIGGVTFDGTANIVPQTIQSVNEASDTTCFPLFISASGTQSLQPLNNTALTFNASTASLGCTTFVGALTGNVTGNVSGSSGSTTGNAATATALATARAIYGNNFDGTAALTQIIASTFGGTGNGFTKISGPTTSEKTVTIPDANLTITAAAATVLDDTTVGAMVDTLGGATSSGTGGLVRITSASLITPALGVATATSLNGLTISTTTGTLTLANSSSIITSGGNAITFTSTGTTGVTLPTTGTLATLAGSETFTNKTLTSPKIGTSILDTGGNELLVLTATSSAVNEITLANGATGNNATLTASGETNTGITITGKGTKGVAIGNALSEKVSTITDAAGAVIDCSLGNLFTWTAAADRTAGTTTNAVAGQKMIISFTASAAGRTLTLPTATTGDFAFGSDITTLTQTASGKTDVIGCIYNSIVANRWAVVAVSKGY